MGQTEVREEEYRRLYGCDLSEGELLFATGGVRGQSPALREMNTHHVLMNHHGSV